MAYIFGDSFDFYANINDAGAAYWDSSGSWGITSGRFANSQALGSFAISAIQLIKSSGSNDAVHHIVCAFEQTVPLGSTTLGEFIQLVDGSTGQCAIVFRSDGAILLTSGTAIGTVLATYTGAFNPNVWTAFEFEITINNTTGAFHVRKNGNTVDDFAATGLNTRGGTANNFANKLQIGFQSAGAPLNTANTQKLDDLLWFNTTGAAPNTWVGDIRAYQLMPTSDASAQFSKFPNPIVMNSPAITGTYAATANAVRYSPFTANQSGTIGSVVLFANAAATANAKAAIFDSTGPGGSPGAVVGGSNAIANPVTGANTFTFPSPPTVTKGVNYYVGVDQDAAVVWSGPVTSTGWSSTIPYASFPAVIAATSLGGFNFIPAFTINLAPANSALVSEPQEDGTTTYVFDSTVGQADFYGIAPLPLNPTSIVAVTTRGFMCKSDAGTRGGQVQLKSGAATLQSPALVLSTSFLWNARTDTVDPNTSAAWTAAAVNAVQIGPLVQA